MIFVWSDYCDISPSATRPGHQRLTRSRRLAVFELASPSLQQVSFFPFSQFTPKEIDHTRQIDSALHTEAHTAVALCPHFLRLRLRLCLCLRRCSYVSVSECECWLLAIVSSSSSLRAAADRGSGICPCIRELQGPGHLLRRLRFRPRQAVRARLEVRVRGHALNETGATIHV